jgi:hypothetical protein
MFEVLFLITPDATQTFPVILVIVTEPIWAKAALPEKETKPADEVATEAVAVAIFPQAEL